MKEESRESIKRYADGKREVSFNSGCDLEI